MQNSAAAVSPEKKRLNVGCGRNIREGWINLDNSDLPGIDVRYDLEQCRTTPIPLPDDSIDEFLLSHVIEHINNALPLMQELWRIAKPNAVCTILTPHGSHDDAWEDPTHVRPYFPNSFAYFSQPAYWRADYGYRGDWQAQGVELRVSRAKHGGNPPQQLIQLVERARNMVLEMKTDLIAIKPMRQPLQELIVPTKATIVFV